MPSCGRPYCLLLLGLVLLLFQCSVPISSAQTASPWPTLDGNAPLVIAKGGHSGLFPDSSQIAYAATLQNSLPDSVLWCNLQLSKDGDGICLPDILMNNYTNIEMIYPNTSRTYVVNGVPLSGYFPLDFYLDNLTQVALTQGVYSRTPIFDSFYVIQTVSDVASLSGPIWLNIQYDIFYSQQKLSMSSYLLSVARKVIIDYVSSPEVSFLRNIGLRMRRTKTQLVFRFLEKDVAEPSTNQTYGVLLNNLTFIKTFASGILVPRSYIWPVNASLYLEPVTTIVKDAHKAGLKIFAADFANDNVPAYDYNYDPVAEYLSFINNDTFSVDGVLTDSPVTASEAIGCFSHVNKAARQTGKLTVISHNGASGIYPGCTNLAYGQAVDDGADYIDCPIQVTKDGVLVCMSDVNLFLSTTVSTSLFNTRSSIIPEIQSNPGVFTFNLTWEEILKNLKPQISTPLLRYEVVRHPLHKNVGDFTTLADFLTFAKDKNISGVLISIEHAAFLAEKVGFSVTDAVLKALGDSGYDNQTSHKVIIQSTSSSVLKKFKQQSRYELMYTIDEYIDDAQSSSISDISGFADSVAIRKHSIYPESKAFIVGKTEVVRKFQSAKIPVYGYLFMNEFVSQAWDFFSDPIAEINTYFQDAGINGVITDYPGTANAFRRNPCLSAKTIPLYMLPVQPGSLDNLLTTFPGAALPPTLSPMPTLTEDDVVEPPLPAAANITETKNGAPTPQTPNGQPSTSVSVALCVALMATAASLLI